MKTLFQEGCAAEIQGRLENLKADSPRQWGKMDAAQMLAHCSAAMEMALGDVKPARMLIGRLIGQLVKSTALKDTVPMRKDSPTAKILVVSGERNFVEERARLGGLIKRFLIAGPAGCTRHPHTFFGPLTPEEWSVLMYKHLDHHLRQFGV